MKKIIIVIAFFILVGTASAEYKFAENWSKADTAWQVTFIAVTAIDWAQTRSIAKQDWECDGKKYHENNFILGDHPSSARVDIYTPFAALGHTLIAMALPSELIVFDYKINPRRIWQGVWIGIETGFIISNYNVGVRIEF